VSGVQIALIIAACIMAPVAIVFVAWVKAAWFVDERPPEKTDNDK
jgi:hypothetical protein